MTPKFEYLAMQSNRPLLGALIATGVLQLIFCFLAWAKVLGGLGVIFGHSMPEL
jgi:hypothetical protein